MDGDMRRALAAGLADVDEEEEDWDAEGNLLDDDFVMQAAGVGEVSGALLFPGFSCWRWRTSVTTDSFEG